MDKSGIHGVQSFHAVEVICKYFSGAQNAELLKYQQDFCLATNEPSASERHECGGQ